MKKILGLDLGTTSIGWAIVEATDEKKENPITGEKSKTDINNDRIGIHEDAVGVRIIPADEMQRRFNEGKKLNDGEKHTPTADRRIKRSSRRANSRYKLRRDKLLAVLEYLKLKPVGSFVKNGKGGWIDDRTNGKLYSKEKEYVLNSKGQQIHKRQPDNDGDTDIGKQLYKLRDRAIREKIELEELGRILLLLNQWRGYSSDRFTKDEKSNFDYYTATVVELDENPVDIVYEDKEKTKLKWNQYAVSLQFTDPIKDESDNLISNLTGFHFCQKLKFKIGDIISFKYEKKETKVKKVVVNQYFKINLVNPNPEDWNFRYQNLNKTLTEWCNDGGSVGSYFYQNFYVEKNIDRIRTNVVNRNWYENELKKIFKKQYAEHREYFQQFDINSVLEVAFKDKNIHSKVKNTQPEEGEDPLEAQLRCLISECIIYFQRPWQQAKNKGACRFEKIKVWKERVKKGTQEKERFETYEGRTVVPRSHPLHQEFKVWQQINNVRLFYIKDGKVTNLFDENNADLLKQLVGKDTTEIKLLLYGELQQKKSLSWISFIEKTLNISVFVEGLKAKTKYQEVPTEYFTVNYIKRTKKGELQENLLKGNNTKACLKTILKEKTDEWFDDIAKAGTDDHQNIEVVEKYSYKTCEYKISNLQLLWELIYDITESKSEKVAQNIKKNFPDFTNETCDSLSNINFDDSGMAQLSAKAIRKLLPLMKVYQQDEVAEYPQKVLEKIIHLLDQNKNDLNNETPEEERLESLRDLITDANARKRLSKFVDIKQFVGLNYWESAAVIYGQHAKHGEQSENIKKDIEKLFEPVKRNSVNNPVVEKIVNETISLCKEIYQRYGFDEVRIELSRELKASREEREQMWEGMNKNAARTEWAKTMLRELMNDDKHKHSNLDSFNKNNIDKIKIIEDVVKFQTGKLYEEKTKEFKLNEPTKAEIMKYLIWLEQNFRCPYTNQFIPLTDVFSKIKRVEIEHIIPKERYFDNSFSNKVITWTEVNTDKADNGNRTAFEYIVSKRSASDSIKLASGKTVNLVSADKWEEHIKSMFPKGRKQMNLLRKSIPDDPISRQLKETQYISVLVKERLGKVIGVDKVWTTSGAITDMLRQSWHLNDVMKELLRKRYENFEISMGSGKKPLTENLIFESENVNIKTGEIETKEVFPLKSGDSLKRFDHRHHALDALVIACTKQQHIQYINSLNAQYSADIESDKSQKNKYKNLRNSLCVGDKKTIFKTPWNENDFIPRTKEAITNIIVSHKNTKLLISPTRHKDKNNLQEVSSIRGSLHKGTNYGIILLKERKYFRIEDAKEFAKKLNDAEKKVFLSNDNWKFKIDDIERIAKPRIKEIVNTWITSQNGNLEKAILSIPYSNKEKNEFLIFVTVWKEQYTTTNNISKTKGIYDDRILIKLSYLNAFQKRIKKEIKDVKNEFRIKALSSQIYQNTIYDVQIKVDNNLKWIELKDLSDNLVEKISYKNTFKSKERIIRIKELIKSRVNQFGGDYNKAFNDVFTEGNTISLDDKSLIPVKTIRAFAKTDSAMFEVKRKSYAGNSTRVELGNNFMVYVFGKLNDQNKHDVFSIERKWDLLSFFDALELKLTDKKVSIEKLYPIAGTPNGYKHIFSLTHHDTVFIRPQINGKFKEYEEMELKELFDWEVLDINDKDRISIISERKKEVIDNLWQVTQFSKTGTGNSINFRRLNTAKGLVLPIYEIDIQGLTNSEIKNKLLSELIKQNGEKTEEESSETTFDAELNDNNISITNNDDNIDPKGKIKPLEENISPYNNALFENCIKVFTNKLGKKVVPYWNFKDGCWNKDDAIANGLL